mgnify:CR=1 FL=1|jgi:hypothetical protein
MSGYARDKKIISHFNDNPNKAEVYPYLIIYLEKQDPDDVEFVRFNQGESLLQKARKINGFQNIYKLGVGYLLKHEIRTRVLCSIPYLQ